MSFSHLTTIDTQKVYIGPGGSYIMEDSNDLTFYDPTVATTKTLTQLVTGGAGTLDSAFDGGKVINGAVTQAAAMSVGGATDYISFWQEGDNDVRIDTSPGANLNLDAAGGYINIYSDTTKLGFGASGGAVDGYVYHNGTSLTFWDSEVAAELTLQDLAGGSLNNPSITGTVTQIHTGTTQAYSLTANSIVTNDVFQINAANLTSGSAIRIDLTEGTLNGGFYLECWDDTAGSAVKTIGEDGATVIVGVAASDMLSITAGDLQLDNGMFEVDTIQNVTSYVKRNNATGTNAAFEVEQTHTTGGVAVLIDQNATGDVNALEITNAGTGFAVTTTGAVAGGKGYEFIAAASGTGYGFFADGTTGSWLGAAGVGLIHAEADGALNATAAICHLESQTQPAGANDGCVLRVIESGAAQATSYAVNIASTSNEALHVDAGLSLFDERITITLADNTGPALAITNPDTTGDTHAVTITPSGDGAGILISPQTVLGSAIDIVTVASSTVPLLDIDGSTGAGWIGAANVGMIDIASDGTAAHVDSTLLRIGVSGTNISGQNGMGLRIEDTTISGGGTEYCMYISSTNNEAIHVDSGTIVVDETIQAIAGIITQNAETDIADPPTQTNMDTALGAGAAGNDGMIGIINDAGVGTNTWLCVNTNGAWYYAAKLTIGA